jgi:hypothetical protein
MPSRKWMYFSDNPFHIVQRGNNREACFIEAETTSFISSSGKRIKGAVTNENYLLTEMPLVCRRFLLILPVIPARRGAMRNLNGSPTMWLKGIIKQSVLPNVKGG